MKTVARIQGLSASPSGFVDFFVATKPYTMAWKILCKTQLVQSVRIGFEENRYRTCRDQHKLLLCTR